MVSGRKRNACLVLHPLPQNMFYPMKIQQIEINLCLSFWQTNEPMKEATTIQYDRNQQVVLFLSCCNCMKSFCDLLSINNHSSDLQSRWAARPYHPLQTKNLASSSRRVEREKDRVKPIKLNTLYQDILSTTMLFMISIRNNRCLTKTKTSSGAIEECIEKWIYSQSL